jgi:Bacterial Ig-like domain
MMPRQFKLWSQLGIAGAIVSGIFSTAKLSYARSGELTAPIVENATPNFHDPVYVELATAESQPVLKGTAPANSTLKFILPWYPTQQNITTVTDAEGKWKIQLPKITSEGKYNIYIQAELSKGSQRTQPTNLILLVDRTVPAFNVEVLVDRNQLSLRNNPLVNAGARFIGFADGTGSGMKELRYQIGSEPAVVIPISDNGLFNISFNIKNLMPGSYPVKFIATDQAGNQKIFDTYKLRVSAQSKTIGELSEAPVFLRLLQDTGESTNDRWTSRPEVVIDLLSGSKVKKLEARLLPSSLDRNNRKVNREKPSEQSHLTFRDITSWINLNSMNLLLSEKTMTDLDYAQLPSGAYTLEVRGDFENGKPFAGDISFVIDRRIPTMTLSNYDGIAWGWGDHLLGIVQDDLGPIKIDYKLIENVSQKIVSRGTWQVPPGRIDILMPELVKANKKMQEEISYSLQLTVRDLAGNQDNLNYRFFILSTKELTDEDFLRNSRPTHR